MRIMFCEGTLSNGGAERVVSNLANYLSDENDIKIVSMTKTNIAYELNSKIYVEFLDKRMFVNKIKKKNRIIKNIKRLIRLNKSIKRFKPDVIISFLPEPSFLVLILKKFNKIPVIVSVRNDPKIEYKSKIYGFLMKKLYPLSDGMVFQTNEAMKYFDNIVHCTREVIPNPINENFIVKNFSKNRNKEIVNVGRLQEQKNQKLLINAFSKLPKQFDDYKLIIYGEGYLRDKLTEQIKNLKLEDKVYLLGTTQNIKDKIYNAAMFVLSSDYEGMPNALMEAMTLGLPVVSTDCPCGGPRFLIQNNKNGILVDVNNEKQLTEAMKKILSDHEFSLKLQNNALKIQRTLDPKKINLKWKNFIINIYMKR